MAQATFHTQFLSPIAIVHIEINFKIHDLSIKTLWNARTIIYREFSEEKNEVNDSFGISLS